MKKTISYTIIILQFISATCCSQTANYNSQEKQEVSVFNDFKNYVYSCIIHKYDITDSARLNYIVSNYIFINSRPDSSQPIQRMFNNLTPTQFYQLKETLNTFYQFLQGTQNQNPSSNLVAIPARLSNDKFIYNRLTSFQKNNTLVFFDKEEPTKTLGYMLFIPPIKNIESTTKIWSWTLLFKFGKFMFRSSTGEEGYEYLFSPELFKR
jgi:hypothetical protein